MSALSMLHVVACVIRFVLSIRRSHAAKHIASSLLLKLLRHDNALVLSHALAALKSLTWLIKSSVPVDAADTLLPLLVSPVHGECTMPVNWLLATSCNNSSPYVTLLQMIGCCMDGSGPHTWYP